MPYRTIEVLLVGTQRLPDGRTVSFDRARVGRICQQANQQLKAGIRIPFSWMHKPGARPIYLSHDHPAEWMAKGYFGEPVKFAQEPRSGNMLAKVWIHDDEDARQFDKVGQVSPGLVTNWVDDRNVLWPELTVAHIAATARPVQRNVARVGKYPATYEMSHPADDAEILLSYPATPRSEPMADEEDKEKETDEAPDIEEVEGETPAEEPAEAPPVDDGASSMDIAEIIDLLKQLHIHGMDGVSNVGDLKVALKAAVHTLKGGNLATDETPTDGDGDADDDGVPDNLEEVPAPVLMSHPVVKTWIARIGKAEHESRLHRLKDCLTSGKITKAMHDKDVQELTAINLSQPTADHFNPDGTIKPTRLDLKLEVYESLPKANTPPGKSAPIEMSHPVEPVTNPVLADADQKRAEFITALEKSEALKTVNDARDRKAKK